MDKLIIRGGRPLKGRVAVGGAKNSALKALAAALLTPEPVTLTRVPVLRDVDTMARLLRGVGARVDLADGTAVVKAEELRTGEAPYDLVRAMRASFVVLGPLLARHGTARVSLPGGCAIGQRPVDLHLKGLAALGAEITTAGGYVEARARKLRGADVVLEFASVGATENILMAATLAEGTTVISNAAREPEIQDLAALLAAMGARIAGAGTDTITVEGVRALHGANHEIVGDRIEAGSFLVLSLMTGGGITVEGARREHLHALEAKITEAGGAVREEAGGLHAADGGRFAAAGIVTAPYPGFPTDLQAQWMALMTTARGACVIRETVFENRFQHVPELVRMGAAITVKGATAVVDGVAGLKGAPVMVSDLRAGFALVMAALAAAGTSEVLRVYHLDRGYERLVDKLRALGADVERVPGSSI